VIERLLDMGIEPYLAAAALNGVISQRLVRRICSECKAPATLSARQSRLLALPSETPVFEGRGCSFCNFSGYRSRFAIYEYIILNEEKRRQICTDFAKFSAEVRAMGNLRKNAIRAVTEGRTTADEVIHALNRDGDEG
jgi:type IV pilus assembly protein PilB